MNIDKLGEKLVYCNLNCQGINNNREKGIIPRCLVCEKRKGKNKSIVVGLNPGKCKSAERQYYLKHGPSYRSVKNYFAEEGLCNRAYFKKIRELISFLGCNGDILWTELVKCECFGKNGILPIQTSRVCINRFLRKELELFNAQIIFAIGNVAFDFCALSFPDHFVVGVPHPTGAYGTFTKIRKRILKNLPHYIKILSKQKDDHGNYIAIHLSQIK